ncbi:MAG TPA: hypothetical protein VF144_12145, partial [Chitinophagaceae bacterium]
VEFPTGSGNWITHGEVANEISMRLISIFRRDERGHRPVNDGYEIYRDEHFKDLVLFYEYFHGDSARGVGASHQTGWTGVVAELINRVDRTEEGQKVGKPVSPKEMLAI